MSQFIRNVSLVRTDDPGYRRFCSELAAAHRRLGPPQDPGPEYRLSPVLERAARAMLADHVALLEERVLRYEVPAGPQTLRALYRELDAVAGPLLGPTCLFEIKCTHNRARAIGGHRQLEKSAEALVLLNPELRGSVIWVDTRHYLDGAPQDEDEDKDAAPFPEAATLEALASALTAHEPLPDLVRLPVADVWARATAEDPAADPAMWAACREIAHKRALKLRQRRELEQAGIPRELWPQEVQPMAPAAPSRPRIREDARAGEFRHNPFAKVLEARAVCA